MQNPYSEEERLQAMISACYRASRSHFSHLPIRQIINPPPHLLDAALARHVAIHLLNVEWDIPRRRIVALLGLGRATVAHAVDVIYERRQEPVFERTYERISARAKDLFMEALHDAASREEAA
jgi:hypothetical protein